MRVFVVNAGSSSLKFAVMDTDRALEPEVRGVVALGARPACEVEAKGQIRSEPLDHPVSDHRAAVGWALQLTRRFVDPATVEAVGHRVVHGGTEYSGAVRVDERLLEVVERCIPFAPLHNPANLAGIRACLEAFPQIPQVAVFDNAFHRDLPQAAYLYALPRALMERHGIRRYGFHGLAFASVIEQLPRWTGRPAADLRVVTLMLGSGTTANAWDRGRSVEVSTGFTPLEGLVQATRCGDVDAGLLIYLMRAEGLDADGLEDLLYRKSGWLGLSGLTADMRTLLRMAEEHEGAKVALDVFVHRTKKYVGAYAAVMGGLDVLVFTGPVGQGSALIRQRVCEGLEFLGIALDPTRNEAADPAGAEISRPGSQVRVYALPVREEAVIAQQVTACLGRQEG